MHIFDTIQSPFKKFVDKLKRIIFLFSQIRNPPNKRRTNTDGDPNCNDAIAANLRRIQVNTQVTALTSFVEFVG